MQVGGLYAGEVTPSLSCASSLSPGAAAALKRTLVTQARPLAWLDAKRR